MNEQVVRGRLDLLTELESRLDELEEERTQAVEAAIPPEVKERIKEIEAEFADLIHPLGIKVAGTKVAIKDTVLALGSTVKGTGYMAVWSKGRVTWDGKGLSGYMVAHPEIEAFRKVGKPSVSVRRRK